MHGAATQVRKNNHTRYAHESGAEQQQRLMLSGSAFKLSARFSSFPTTKLFASKVICRHPSPPRLCGKNAAPILSSWLENTQAISSSLSVFNCHSSSCLLAKHGVIGASIWHALLPSSFLFVNSARKMIVSNSIKSGVALSSGIHAGRFIDGSWNVAGDARPARWLHNSTWLLFGFCSCFSAAATSSSSMASSLTVACCEAEASSKLPSPENEALQEVEAPGSHGKKVYKDFSVIGIPGDGRCLFRAVAHGVCTKQGKPASNEDSQRELADELRNQVVDELIKRRSESEWFIEGDFDQYTERMREPHVWGGEPELLMLSHVLKQPITVYMSDRSSNGLIAIAEYGQEYGKDDPIQVLYHGFGHYDALRIHGEATTAAHSRL